MVFTFHYSSVHFNFFSTKDVSFYENPLSYFNKKVRRITITQQETTTFKGGKNYVVQTEKERSLRKGSEKCAETDGMSGGEGAAS